MSQKPFSIDPEINRIGLYAPGQTKPVRSLEDLPNYDPKKHTVIVLPGTRVTHELPPFILGKVCTHMNDTAKQILTRIGIEDVNLATLAYGHNDEQMIADHYTDQGPLEHPLESGATRPTGIDVHDFVRWILLPKMGLKDGHRPTLAEACDNMSRLTLLAHSYGPGFAKQLSRCFRGTLVAQHGYSQQEADRIASEVVELDYANMSDITSHANPEKDEPGFRTIAFVDRCDPTIWDTMGRVVEEHIADGQLPADADRIKFQEHYYHASGCQRRPDIALQHKIADKVSPPRPMGKYHRLIRVDSPESLSWERLGKDGTIKEMEMNQTKLDEECGRMNNGIRVLRSTDHILGLNTQPLVRAGVKKEDSEDGREHHGVTPPHDHRMYWQLARENKKIVTASDNVIKAALTREPMLDRDVSKTLAEIAFAAPLRSSAAERIIKRAARPPSEVVAAL